MVEVLAREQAAVLLRLGVPVLQANEAALRRVLHHLTCRYARCDVGGRALDTLQTGGFDLGLRDGGRWDFVLRHAREEL